MGWASEGSGTTGGGDGTPVVVTTADQLSQNVKGSILASEGNVFTNTTGSTTGSGAGFTPPYDFMLDATSGLEAALKAQVGPH